MNTVKAEILIRKGRDGFELNYGRQVMGELEGIKFCSEDWYMDMFGLPYTVEEIPEFLVDFDIGIEVGHDKKMIHVFRKEDLGPLAAAISKLRSCWAGVGHRNRWLQTWENGEVVNPRVTIDEFYSGLTQEEIEASNF